MQNTKNIRNNNVSVSFKMDRAEKERFEELLKDMGLSLSAAFNIFAKAVIQESAIPFKVKSKGNIPNAETRKAIENIENGVDLEDFTIG